MNDCYPCSHNIPCPPSHHKPCTCVDKYFSVILGDVKTYTVAPATHELTFVKGVVVYDINGEELGVEVNLSSNKTVVVSANISLINCTLIIF